MKKIYLNYLKSILQERIPAELDGFEKCKVRIPADGKKNSNIAPNEQIYFKKVDDRFWIFLCISPTLRQDIIMLEVGWSNKGRFPWDIHRPLMGIKNDHSEFSKDECLVNYGGIYVLAKEPNWPGHGGWYIWKCSVPENDPTYASRYVVEDLTPISDETAKQRVADAINGFIVDVKSFVLPYLEKRIEHYLRTKL